MQISLFLPELVLIFSALTFFFLSLLKGQKAFVRPLAVVLAGLALIASGYAYGREGELFFSAYRIDAFSQLYKIIIALGLFIVFWMGAGLRGIEEELTAEYYMFLTISALGLVFMGSAVELLTIIISLEMSSFALYIVIPFRRQRGYRRQMEAGIKYVLFGAVSTGITLYGMSYIFGLTHTTYLAELVKTVPPLLPHQPMALIGMVLMLSGFFYKLALFPMHFWAPDVYEGAANETSGFVATLPKVGAVALLIRLVSLAGMDTAQFTYVLAVIAVISMTVGNLSALVQDDIKRLLAYSSIAHAGYVMVGILSGNETGMSSALYYIAGYLLMNLTCFYVVYNISAAGDNVSFEDLKGLYKKSPLLAFCLAVSAFGMAGIPPTVGFTGKFLLFTGAIQKGLYALVILAVINTGISAFYYLKMVRAAYSIEAVDDSKIKLGVSTSVLGLLLIAAIILTGIFPQSFVELTKEAIRVVQ